MPNKIVDLKLGAKVSLFVSMFSLLFILVTSLLIWENKGYLHYCGMNKEALLCFLMRFSLPLILIAISVVSCFLTKVTMKNMESNVSNGVEYRFDDITNRVDSVVNVLFSIVFAFAFDIDGIQKVILLLAIIVLFYITSWKNSELYFSNPILFLLGWRLYGAKTNVGDGYLVISKDKELKRGDRKMCYLIGRKILLCK